MNIYELKALNEQSGGRFFSRENMRFAGDTMKNFSIQKGPSSDIVYVSRKRAMKKFVPLTVWTFDTKTGRVVHI